MVISGEGLREGLTGNLGWTCTHCGILNITDKGIL